MEARPLIILYTSLDHVDESNRLRALLDKTGLSYDEHEVDQGADVRLVSLVVVVMLVRRRARTRSRLIYPFLP
jgi:hypothetical protein